MNVVALDTETELIRPGCQAPPLACISVCDGTAPRLRHWTEGLAPITELLTSTKLVVGQNIAFDMAVLCAAWPELTPLVFAAYDADRITDTMLREQLADIALGRHRAHYDEETEAYKKVGYSLADLAQRHLGLTLDKDTWRLRYGELRPLPMSEWPEGAKHYASEDARATLEVYRAQEDEYPAEVFADQYRQARAAFALQLQTVHGVRLDEKKYREFASKIETERSALKIEMERAGFVRTAGKPKVEPASWPAAGSWPPGSIEVRNNQFVCVTKPNKAAGTRDLKAIRARLVAAAEASGRDYKRTPKGGVCTDSDACAMSGDPELEAYARYAALGSIASKDLSFFDAAFATGVPLVHPQYQVLVDSGRTSSRGYNVQNMRREPGLREIFVPREGKVFVIADFAGFELHCMAEAASAIAGYSRMGDTLNNGRDLHMQFAAWMLGVDYDAAKEHPEIKEKRQLAKVANFGFPGGMGAGKLVLWARKAYRLDLKEQDIKVLKGRWLEAFPEFVEYFAHVRDIVAGGEGTIKHLYSDRIRGGCSYTETCNTLFQGLGADAAKSALWELARACYVGEPIADDYPRFQERRMVRIDARPLLFVHDEIVTEIPDDNAASVRAALIADVMVRGAKKFLPHYPPRVEYSLARCWSKNAKAIYDEKGQMVPWGE